MKHICAGCLAVVLLLVGAAGAHALGIGDRAPQFVAASTHGPLDLAELVRQKPVVLAFYYADFTSV
ncbi:MAG: hypothetical protein R6W66_05505 [Pelovirga sp.]